MPFERWFWLVVIVVLSVASIRQFWLLMKELAIPGEWPDLVANRKALVADRRLLEREVGQRGESGEPAEVLILDPGPVELHVHDDAVTLAEHPAELPQFDDPLARGPS
jgi:hypothetical protein